MRPFIRFFSSFELAISCMALGIVLVFIGTIAQVQLGIHGATKLYFYSFFLYWEIPGIGVSIPYFPGDTQSAFYTNLVTALRPLSLFLEKTDTARPLRRHHPAHRRTHQQHDASRQCHDHRRRRELKLF